MLAGNLKLQAEGPLKKKFFFLLKRPLICSHLSSHLPSQSASNFVVTNFAGF